MRDLVGSATFGLMPPPITPAGHRTSYTWPDAEEKEAARSAHGLLMQTPLLFADGLPPHCLGGSVTPALAGCDDATAAVWPRLSWLSHIRRWSQAPAHRQ
jgi:hypothetical protein